MYVTMEDDDVIKCAEVPLRTIKSGEIFTSFRLKVRYLMAKAIPATPGMENIFSHDEEKAIAVVILGAFKEKKADDVGEIVLLSSDLEVTPLEQVEPMRFRGRKCSPSGGS